MWLSVTRALSSFKPYTKEEKRLVRAIRMIVGTRPSNLKLYKIATQHISVARSLKKGFKESNERLEYLGDAVLGMVVAGFLFKKYPFKDEGFLTEIRSRIVSRESLNRLAKKIGIEQITKFNTKRKAPNSHQSLYGNALEALIGAVYVDQGFRVCQRFIIRKLLIPHFDIGQLISTTTNYKSKLIEWSQKHSKISSFEHIKTIDKGHFKEFIVRVLINKEPIAKGHGLSKKKAEQDAAREACIVLDLE